ncbi:metalloproteinase [Aphelenchoides avenae]|nr:metalloproteinase [Aphelenchus avenae]
MQYTGYANDPKIDMLAKNRIYQHTMGNVVGPIFNDIKFVNLYNDCMCKSGAKCENGGFPHPRDCSKCVCPEGFGGRTCTERQLGSGGAPLSCGQTIDGNGKRVMLQFDSVTPGSQYECTNSCTFGATEVKFEDLTRGGARVCCPQHAQEFGTVVSAFDLAIVRVCSLRNTQSASIRFRTVDNYGPPDSLAVTSQPVGNGSPYSGGGGGAPKPRPPPKQECKDEETFCYIANNDPYLCHEGDLAEAMQENCRKSCGLC